jgi:Retrotransposon gag protein
MMGQLPQTFTGDCTQADNFIEEVKGYLRLNRDVAGFDSPMKKIAFTLTLIKGPDVTGWIHDIGDMLDHLDPDTDNVPALWQQFLYEFEVQFQDTQKEEWARDKLENLRMKFPHIDQYITEFEELARQAGYTTGNPETTHIFIKGLMQSVMEDVFKAPTLTTYNEIKFKAIQCTHSRVLLENILRSWRQGQGFTGGTFRGFQPNRPRQPFFNQGGGQPQRSQQNYRPPPRYNSSNAPWSMNNVPVPMDLGPAQPQNNWQQRPALYGRAAQDGPPRGKCYNCGKEGHYTHNCHMRHGANICYMDEQNYMDYGGGQDLNYPVMQPEQPQINVQQLGNQLSALSLDQKVELADAMGVSQDFPSA